jgi:Spy/CpxP family protein refolding chaperone
MASAKWEADESIVQLAKALNLTEEQMRKIDGIISAETEKRTSSLLKAGGLRKKLEVLTRAETFDEMEFRETATRLAQVEVDLLVAVTRSRRQIEALLTPDQKALEENFAPLNKLYPARDSRPRNNITEN